MDALLCAVELLHGNSGKELGSGLLEVVSRSQSLHLKRLYNLLSGSQISYHPDPALGRLTTIDGNVSGHVDDILLTRLSVEIRLPHRGETPHMSPRASVSSGRRRTGHRRQILQRHAVIIDGVEIGVPPICGADELGGRAGGIAGRIDGILARGGGLAELLGIEDGAENGEAGYADAEVDLRLHM